MTAVAVFLFCSFFFYYLYSFYLRNIFYCFFSFFLILSVFIPSLFPQLFPHTFFFTVLFILTNILVLIPLLYLHMPLSLSLFFPLFLKYFFLHVYVQKLTLSFIDSFLLWTTTSLLFYVYPLWLLNCSNLSLQIKYASTDFQIFIELCGINLENTHWFVFYMFWIKSHSLCIFHGNILLFFLYMLMLFSELFNIQIFVGTFS